MVAYIFSFGFGHNTLLLTYQKQYFASYFFEVIKFLPIKV